MSSKPKNLCLDSDGPIKIKKWKVRSGMIICARQVIFSYCPANSSEESALLKYKSSEAGIVCSINAKEGNMVHPGEVLLTLEECSHPTVMKDMCAECGADLRKDDMSNVKASVPMVHSIPELKVSKEQAEIIGKADEARLLSDRKLVLLVDLDQTLIHTTNDNIPPNLKDVVHFQLHGPHSPWYHTRIRPGTPKFLESISKYFELHICTFGARNYAHYIALFLDPGGKYFSHRILSRDECFDPNSKTANLNALFPCGDRLVCIIDDREDVWNYASNVIHVKPYHFFQHTGDINAPPGLAKKENDDLLESAVSSNNTEEGDREKKTAKEKIKSGETTTDKDTDDEKETLKNKDKSAASICENQKEDATVITEDKELTMIDGKDGEEEKTNDSKEKSENSTENAEPLGKNDDLIEVEDNDDYLLYLEDILKKIHKAYYEEYDHLEEPKINSLPDLKVVIPTVKKKLLDGCRLVFSGLVPSHVPLKRSRAYLVAESLGAVVTDEVTAECTHLVAARSGTAKVNLSRRFKGINIVTPEWLWHCAERWEKVDERLYPLGRNVSTNRHPPAHCSSPLHPEPEIEVKSSKSDGGRFSDTINPLLTFSSEDMKDMDKEVDDLCQDDDDTDSEADIVKPATHKLPKTINDPEERSSSSESYTEDAPKGWSENSLRREARKRKIGETTTCTESDFEDESPNEKFRRGEPLPSDLDLGEDSQEDTLDSEGNICEDDADWTLMGAALEREFLSGD